MKKTILCAMFAVMLCGAASAQRYMVVNSEKVFKSLSDYNGAITELDRLAAQYQNNVDNAYRQVEQMYNDYQNEKSTLSAAARQAREDAIIASEKKIADYQQEVFGQDGTLMRTRVEKLRPIQDRVFGVINRYAEGNGYTLVLDVAASPSILYYAPSEDKTDDIIKLLK